MHPASSHLLDFVTGSPWQQGLGEDCPKEVLVQDCPLQGNTAAGRSCSATQV